MLATARSLRNSVGTLTNSAGRDLSALWRQVETAAQAETALRDILPALVDQYGAAASVLATEWYDDLRAKQDIRGRFKAFPAQIPNPGTQEMVGWALDTATDYGTFQTLILGGIQRRIANFSRLSVAHSAIADPQAKGWMRVGDGGCEFCEMLLGRGAVYSEESADFESHDHCNCAAAPAF